MQGLRSRERRRGADVVVLEARARIGGRVLSHRTSAGAGLPREGIIQDWATEPLTATRADHIPSSAHPEYRPITIPAPWNPRITLAGAEVAPEFRGYLEAALAAAEAAILT